MGAGERCEECARCSCRPRRKNYDLCAEIGGQWVSLRIRDSGPGISPEVRDKIFEPGVSTKSGGWGVGLALSRRIVEGVHTGKIELLETVEGTTFQIRLPIAEA